MNKLNKKLGQVFLKNTNIRKKISEFINLSDIKQVIEIGPGGGAITEFIDFEKKKYFAIELDERWAQKLKENYSLANIICGDFLEKDLDSIIEGNYGLLFGNIPYYISTPIIFKFLKAKKILSFYLMVQKEYYESLKAKPGDKNYSSFSLLVQSCCAITKLISVNRLNFFPKPKIDSVFLLLTKKETSILNHLEGYSKFLRQSFGMPRKTLYNNWKYSHLNKKLIFEVFEEFNLKPKIRAEEISEEIFIKIFLKKFSELKNHNN